MEGHRGSGKEGRVALGGGCMPKVGIGRSGR